jgi:hypothetical protein
MKYLPVSRDKFAIVDDEDFDFLNRFSWQFIIGGDQIGSVSTNFKLLNGRWVRIPMSRFLYTPKIQYHPVYINKNPLDNRKENIKLVTTSEKNGTSWKMYKRLKSYYLDKPHLRNPTSKYKGVCKIGDPRYKIKQWKATIQLLGKVKTKCFETEKQAALWYNKMAIELFGETAYQNKIEN